MTGKNKQDRGKGKSLLKKPNFKRRTKHQWKGTSQRSQHAPQPSQATPQPSVTLRVSDQPSITRPPSTPRRGITIHMIDQDLPDPFYDLLLHGGGDASMPSQVDADEAAPEAKMMDMDEHSTEGSTNEKYILRVEGNKFIPSTEATMAIRSLIQGFYDGVWPYWTSIKKEVRHTLFKEFMKKEKEVSPTDVELFRHTYTYKKDDDLVSRRLPEVMDNELTQCSQFVNYVPQHLSFHDLSSSSSETERRIKHLKHKNTFLEKKIKHNQKKIKHNQKKIKQLQKLIEQFLQNMLQVNPSFSLNMSDEGDENKDDQEDKNEDEDDD